MKVSPEHRAPGARRERALHALPSRTPLALALAPLLALAGVGCGGERAPGGDGGAAQAGPGTAQERAADGAPEDPGDSHSLAQGALGRRPLTAGPEPGASGTIPPQDGAQNGFTWGTPLGGPTAGHDDQGRARVLESVFDYDTAFEGTQVHHRFTLESSGAEPLVIHGVQSSCGCAVPELWRPGADGGRVAYERGTPLAPGEWLEIDVVFDTRGRPGRQDKPLWLYANLPGGRIELELRGSVRPFLVATPPQFDLGQALVGAGAEGQVELASADGRPVRVGVEQDALPRGVEVDLLPVSPDAEGRATRWQATARVGPNAEAGILRWPIAFQSDRPSSAAPDAPSLSGSVLLAVDLLAAMEFSPPHLTFGVLRPGAVQVQHSSLRFNAPDMAERFDDPDAFRVSVQGELGDLPAAQVLRVSLERAPGGGGFHLEAQVRDVPAGARGRLAGAILIEPPADTYPPVSLTFSGVLTGR